MFQLCNFVVRIGWADQTDVYIAFTNPGNLEKWQLPSFFQREALLEYCAVTATKEASAALNAPGSPRSQCRPASG
jgi:hypothetical protein